MAFLPKDYAQYLGLGVEIAATITIPLGLGYLVDYWFKTFPWFTLGGIAVGLVLFITTVIRISNRLNSNDENL